MAAINRVTSDTAATDRRTAIADAAVAILAADGARGLTHRAVDRRLGLPAGSTSYYVRTRDGLLTAAADAVRTASRETFEELLADHDDPVEVIVEHVLALLTDRRPMLLARRALHTEPIGFDAPLFSPDGARALTAGLGLPAAAAGALIAFLEGTVTVGLTGPPPDRATVTHGVRALLAAPRR